MGLDHWGWIGLDGVVLMVCGGDRLVMVGNSWWMWQVRYGWVAIVEGGVVVWSLLLTHKNNVNKISEKI